MSCTSTPADPYLRIRNLERSLRKVEADLAQFHSWTGISEDPTRFFVTMLSSDYDPDTDKFTLVWVSEPGSTYQVQESTDGTTWTKVVNVEAEADAVQTSWLSDVYGMDDLPVFFRVVRYPSTMPVCTPA